jgi:predicted aspartyl protease
VSHSFSSRTGPIVVAVEISGPKGKVDALLLLDTGATTSTINRKVLQVAGYDPSSITEFVEITAGTGTASVPRLMLNRLSALGKHAIGIRVLAHDLPAGVAVDGLLGLDFFRDLLLTLDFRQGLIELS